VRKAVAGLKSGQILRVAGDDPVLKSRCAICVKYPVQIIEVENIGPKAVMMIQL